MNIKLCSTISFINLNYVFIVLFAKSMLFISMFIKLFVVKHMLFQQSGLSAAHLSVNGQISCGYTW